MPPIAAQWDELELGFLQFPLFGFFDREWFMKELETFARRGRIVPVFMGSFEAIQAAAEAAVAKGAWRGFGRFDWSEEGYQVLVQDNTKYVWLKRAGGSRASAGSETRC
jgi:hypothetical protein